MKRVKIHKTKLNTNSSLIKRCIGYAMIKGSYSNEYREHLSHLKTQELTKEVSRLKYLE